MASTDYFTLKDVQLKNNCPECYSNDGLHLTFKQKMTDNVFVKAITEDTKHEMHCKTCNTEIFPVRWDDDIERVVAYHERAVVPKKKSFKLKPLAYAFIIVDLLIIIGIVLFVTGIIEI
ncbi:hypothetical protein Q2T40_16935 [Winogradskyella maritima]|uniref:Uncharacterized protein n=1 Tax=Winogradskyella maritima TaxID=1517766 RepID=A0ABV8AHT0_9FLAO|nr:hypothetical protein [Winogradskyella maritima]